MRIISGKYKGKRIDLNIEGTRPTMDRVKESIFSTIQNYIDESIVLDLFSGTGNLGIEAISNGANKCYFNDFNKKACNDIINTIKNFKIEDKTIVLNKDYKDALLLFKNNSIKFDLVFLDPPYKNRIIEEIIDIILKYDLLNENGLIICEYEYDKLELNNILLKEIKDKKYGSKKVTILKR